MISAMPREITVGDCEHAQTSWFLTGARVLDTESWSEGGLTWARGLGHADLLFPTEIDPAALAQGLARARRPGEIVGAWLSLDVDPSPLAAVGFERGWSPWWMTAKIAEVGETSDSQVALKEETSDYTGEHADYAQMLALTRERPHHTWYAAAYTDDTHDFAGPQHGSFRYFIKDAHSVLLQTLGELGAIGFGLLIGMLATGLTVAARRLGRAQGSPQSAIAGLLGSFVVYLIGAGIDWMWELTAVTAIGICVLGLLTGPATAAAAPPAGPGRRHERSRIVVAAAGVLACGIIVTEGITLLAGIELSRSQAEARAGHTALARSHAIAATKIEPWAATPYLQLALVDQSAGDLPAAHIAIGRSIRADHDDWRPWLVAARIENRLGEIAAASHSLARAKSLNPRSPLVSLEG